MGVLKLQKNCNQSCSSNLFAGLVQMTLWLVHDSYSLLDRQVVKLTFFARVSRQAQGEGGQHFFTPSLFPSHVARASCSPVLQPFCAPQGRKMQTGLPSYGNRAYVSAHPLVEISGGSRGASHDSFGVKREESWESFRSTEACRKFP